MLIIRGINRIKKFRRPVVALGVFDGVHRGHSLILKSAAQKARRIRGTSIAFTFWPHPQKEESLYSLKHRLRLIEGLGIDACIVVDFKKGFSLISPEGFVRDILMEKIGADYIYIGKNFRFGRDAGGGFRDLSAMSRTYGFKLKGFPVIKSKGKPVSSTYIRFLIKKGELFAARNLLGRPVSILGTVIRGSLLARKLGFPTANINPHHEVIPPDGIYSVKVFLDGRQFYGICYIGMSPTLLESGRRRIEAHIFNFRKNIYGKDLEIQFLKKLREDRKFSSAAELSLQIKKDISSLKKSVPPH